MTKNKCKEMSATRVLHRAQYANEWLEDTELISLAGKPQGASTLPLPDFSLLHEGNEPLA